MPSPFPSQQWRWPTFFLWLYGFVLAALFVAGTVIRFSLPSVPFIDADISYYLLPAIQRLSKYTDVYATNFRFIYPSFVTVVLGIFQNLNALSYIQHIIGVSTAALIFFIFFRLRAFLPAGKYLDGMVRIVALVAAGLFLFSPSPIKLEHSIRPEALFPTACAFTILAGVEFSRRVFLEKRTDWLSSLWMFLLILCAVGTYYLKPAWGLTICSSLLPLALALIWIPGKWLWKLGLPLIGCILAFLAFVLPEHVLQNRSHNNKAGFLPETLFCTHAEFFQDILQRDALSKPSGSTEQVALLKFVKEIHNAISNSPKRRYGLAMDPDELMHRGPLEELMKGLRKYDVPFHQFCYHYYFSAWREHPFLMLKKIFKQMEFFYSPKKTNIYDKSNQIKLAEKYQSSLKKISHIQHPYWQPVADYQKSLQERNFHRKVSMIVIPGIMKPVFIFLNSIFFPILALSLLGVAVVFLSGSRLAHWKPAAWIVLYLASFNLANCLTISVVHMMNVSRYHFNQIAMSLISQGFEFLFLVGLVVTYIHQRRKSRP